MHTWIDWIRVRLGLEKLAGKDIQLSITGRCYLHTGKNSPPQAGHNDFENNKTTNLGHVFLATEDRETKISVCPVLHFFVYSLEYDKDLLCKFCNLEEVLLERCSLFIGHGYVRHTEGGWKGTMLHGILPTLIRGAGTSKMHLNMCTVTSWSLGAGKHQL